MFLCMVSDVIKLSEKSKEIFLIINKDELVSKFIDELNNYHLETAQHSIRTLMIALELGIEENLLIDELKILGYSAILHDVGKLKIPIEILSKSDKLDFEEDKIMRKHSLYSFKMLEGMVDDIIRKIIVGHHEYNTLKSYPRDINNANPIKEENRVEEDKIAKLKEILAIADVYEALMAKRAYKPKFTKEQISSIMTKDNFNWDGNLVSKVLDMY